MNRPIPPVHSSALLVYTLPLPFVILSFLMEMDRSEFQRLEKTKIKPLIPTEHKGWVNSGLCATMPFAISFEFFKMMAEMSS